MRGNLYLGVISLGLGLLPVASGAARRYRLVKAPQQTYKTIYPGSSIDPSETDTKRTFKALVAIAQNIISAKNTVDQMLKRQFAQAASQ
jgi:hypothetical protein